MDLDSVDLQGSGIKGEIVGDLNSLGVPNHDISTAE